VRRPGAFALRARGTSTADVSVPAKPVRVSSSHSTPIPNTCTVLYHHVQHNAAPQCAALSAAYTLHGRTMCHKMRIGKGLPPYLGRWGSLKHTQKQDIGWGNGGWDPKRDGISIYWWGVYDYGTRKWTLVYGSIGFTTHGRGRKVPPAVCIIGYFIFST